MSPQQQNDSRFCHSTPHSRQHDILKWLLTACILCSSLLSSWSLGSGLSPAPFFEETSPSLSASFYVLEDPNKNLNANQIFHDRDSFPLSQSISNGISLQNPDSNYWVLWKIRTQPNSTYFPGILYIGAPYPLFVDLELYHFEDGTLIQKHVNDDLIQSNWRKSKTHPGFHLLLAPGKKHYLILNLKSEVIQRVRFDLHTSDQFAAYISNDGFMWGLFYGVICIISLFNLLIFAATRDRMYLYYMAFVISNGLIQATITGHGFKYLWAGSVFWTHFANVLFIGLTGIFTIKFTQHFLDTIATNPALHRILNWLLLPCVILMAGGLLPFGSGIYVAQTGVAGFTILFLLVALTTRVSKNKPRQFFFLGC